MTDNAKARERIARIARALAAKTVENGCTEDEALAAAEQLAKVLRDHNMTMDEAEARETPFKHHEEAHEDGVGQRLWKVADGVSYLTGTRYWTSPAGFRPVRVHFFGYEHEVDVARYLLEICARAMRGERDRLRKAYALLRPEVRKRRIVPFLDGMADSLRRRLKAMKPTLPPGKGLVVLRDELVVKAMEEEGIRLTAQQERRSRAYAETYRAGVEAGERVRLNPGLAGQEGAPRLR